jgi:hypothetical protein
MSSQTHLIQGRITPTPEWLNYPEGYCQIKLTWDGAGGFVAWPYDKTLPIQVF